MKKKTHIHQYERVIIGKKGTYIVLKCMLSNCKHFMPDPSLAIGHLSQCPWCSEPFQLNKENILLKKPMCEDCRELRKKTLEQLKEVV